MNQPLLPMNDLADYWQIVEAAKKVSNLAFNYKRVASDLEAHGYTYMGRPITNEIVSRACLSQDIRKKREHTRKTTSVNLSPDPNDVELIFPMDTGKKLLLRLVEYGSRLINQMQRELGNMNKSIIHIAGNLVKDAEQKPLSDGGVMTFFTVASTIGYKEKKTTNYFTCYVFNKIPDWKLGLMKKGTNVDLTGELKLTKTEKDGKTYLNANIRVWEFEIVGKLKTAEEQQSQPVSADDDYVPF